jgi:hypothetical protein
MTGSRRGQPDQHPKGGLCRQQCSSPDADSLSEGFETDLSDFKPGNSTLKGDYLQQVVDIVTGGVPTMLEVRFMCLFMFLGRVLL